MHFSILDKHTEKVMREEKGYSDRQLIL